MLLKFCEDNFLFYITHTKYFDILCVFVVLFFLALFILTQKNEFIDKFKNSNFKMFTTIFSFGIFVGFLVFLFAWILNKNEFEGCSTRYYQNIYFKVENCLNKTLNNLKKSKVIIVGDSRMEFIDNDKEIIKPFNFEFVAKSGMRIDWFKNTALPKVRKILKDNEFNYYIIVNMGVNDLNSNYKGKEIAEDYFELYSKLAKGYPDVDVYIMSVNPIWEDKLNKWEKPNKRTVKKIKLFNNTIQNELTESSLENIHYCDAYNTINFNSDDGLHYTQDTNKDIIKYIVSKCIDFN